MKKNRFIALALVFVMAVSLLPMAALAAETDPWYAFVDYVLYGSSKDKLGEWDNIEEIPYWDLVEQTGKSGTIDRKDYERFLTGSNGYLYELVGMHGMTNTLWENAENTSIVNGKTSVTVKPAPDPADYKTDEEYLAAYDKWAKDNTDYVILSYAPHEHAFDGWKTNATNHWHFCCACKANFLDMNWHFDKDEDGKCDDCEMDIVYYDITVVEATGGKVTEMEGDKDGTAAYNDTVEIKVEADEGYVVKDVRFYKVREDGSKSQIVRNIITPGEAYSFVMPNFDVEIVVTYAEA